MHMEKVKLAPVKFAEINEREEAEYGQQLKRLQEMYGDEAEFLKVSTLGEEIPEEADAVLFPQMIFAAYRHDEIMRKLDKPLIIITSAYGTVEMWDWEVITYLKDLGCRIFSPYSTQMGKTILRALGIKRHLKGGASFLIFQDSPGEGMQANIFKKFYWWEKESIYAMQEALGCRVIYRSYQALCEQAKAISDEEAEGLSTDWNIHSEGVSGTCFLKAVKLYAAVKRVIEELGGVDGVGANCLNESFYCDTTPCLAWNMLFEKEGIIWACEGDVLSLLSTYIIYRTVERPVMMTNLYPFLVGMAALSHEKIEQFPDIKESDNCALGVHCGYFGFVPRKLSDSWVLRPKVLEIVDEEACMVDARMRKGPVTLAKIYPGFKKLSIIEAELEDYVQYPGSDCRNGALIRYKDGHRVMEELCSHHSLIIEGKVKPYLLQLAKVFQWDCVVM